MDYTALAEHVVAIARSRGADAAEAYLQAGRTLSVEVRNGSLETVQEAASEGIGVRVFVQGRMAFASCNDLAPTSVDAAVTRAIEFARSTTADPSNVLPTEKGMTPVEGLYDASFGQVTMARKIELATRLEALAMKAKGITKSDGATYGEREARVFLANSNGLSKTYSSSSCSLGVSIVAEKGEQRSSGGERCGRRFFADLEKPEAIAAKAAARALESLDPRMVKTQRAAVIVDPDVAGSFIGGIVQAINGERVLQRASFLGAMLNQKIGSELFTLTDDGTRAKGLASAPFDGEGVPTQKRVLVEKGVLKGFIYNTAVAKRAGLASTGNAARGGFTSLPNIGVHNIVMAAGTTPPADIVKATKLGLWLKGVTGYGINPVNGNFSGGASGLWIENGQVAFPVKGLTIAATAAEILNGIDLAGTEVDLNDAMSAPMFRIREMQVGGE
jgi:PmbA protein